MANDYERDNRAAALRVLPDIGEIDYGYTAVDVEQVRKRRERIAQMRRQKERQLLMRKLAVPIVCAVILCIAVVSAVILQSTGKKHKSEKTQEVNQFVLANGINLACSDITGAFQGIQKLQEAFVESQGFHTLGGKSKEPVFTAQADENTIGSVGDSVSENIIFIDVDDRRILAQKDAKMRISPASMTKILTILVAAEHITDPEDRFEITIDITDYSFVHDCSNAGFEVGECVLVKDLFYGTILPSGADAAMGLAEYAAGSQEAFVALMNEKLESLGLSETSHFTNCIGIYDDNHYSTVYDMAVILKAAYDNPFCREVLSSHIYTTSATPEHPDGLILSNLFLRRIEDRDTYGEVLCAKTGYVDQSGSCAASLSLGNDGKLYICVSAHSTNSWRCIRDHVAFYQYFLS